MHARTIAASELSDTELVRRLADLAGRERCATVELIAHLAELASRKLHRAKGYSLFRYCTEELRLSEHAAFNRIAAARASRSFPLVLDLLAEGAVNLATLRLLAPHLTLENHERLLAEAHGRSKREVEVIVARIAPQADVRTSVRKLPAPRPAAAASEWSTPAQPALQPTVSRPAVAPLSAERYRIQFTPRSRHVPAEVKRKVWIRDHGQCAFVSPAGRRCRERAFLEFHHVDAFALGGDTTVDNISLRCREHNAHEAELLFGPWDPAAVREPQVSYSIRSGPGCRMHNELCPTRPGASWANATQACVRR